MATRVIKDVTLRLEYKVGVNTKGEDVINKQTFSNLSLTATDQGLVNFAERIAKYIAYPVRLTYKTTIFTINA